MRLLPFALLACAAGTARGDGFFYQQSYGISSARGQAAPMIGESLQLRIALGWRFGPLQVGPWIGSHVAGERGDNALFWGTVGGDPVMGDTDMDTYGVDARYNARIHDHLSAYVRGGPRYARGTGGVLDGYRGFGLGAGTGVALTGKVRALGFVAVPLFFMKKGPMVNATLFIDYNVEWHRLHGPGMSELSMPLLGTSIGFGAGSFF
jgi:hypothetical protein